MGKNNNAAENNTQPTVEELQAQLAQASEMNAALAKENEGLQKKIDRAGVKIKPTVTIDGEEHTVAFRKTVLIEKDDAGVISKRVLTAEEIANDPELAKKLKSAGFGGLISEKQRAANRAKHAARRKASKETMVVK